MVLLIYCATDIIAAWGLNLQYGMTGVLNFGFIVQIAVGAYVYAVFTLGPSSGNGGFQSYIIGLSLPPALAMVIAVVVGCAVGGIMGMIGMKRLRPDYQAIVLLVTAIVALTVVEADNGMFNGNPGLSLIPNPTGGTGPTGGNGWVYVLIVFALCLLSYLVLRRFSNGPLGRSLRAVRDDDQAALAIGKNVIGLRILVQVVGGGFGALSGALLVGFIGAWSPAAWQLVETLSLLTAIIVGGVGSNLGVVVGVILVPVIFEQATLYMPGLASRPELATNIGGMITALLTIGFIWRRPRGLAPERRPKYGEGASRSRFTMAPLGSPLPAGNGTGGGADVAVPAGEHVGAPDGRTDMTAPGRIVARPRETVQGRPVGALSVSDLTLHYGGVIALDGVSFEAAAGAITGLIGPNGAGKSTLINVVSGFSKAESGRVVFDGKDITRLAPQRRARSGLVRTFQLSRQFSRLTVMENLLVARGRHPAETLRGIVAGVPYWRVAEEENVARARDLLAMFEMSDKLDEPARNLSSGQQRMVELMRALMTEPQMLMLDEPLAGLSPRWAGRFEDAISRLRDQGIGFLLIEHELGIVDRLCQSVVVMARGRVLSVGTMGELRTQREVQEAYVVG